MAIDVKPRFRSFLPGAGFDSSGNPKQGKTRVVGQVDVTAYSGGGGEPFNAVDIGLTTIDSITLRVADENSGAMSDAGGVGSARTRHVSYAKSTGHFYLYFMDGAGSKLPGVGTADTETLEFDAFGDSASDVELT
jgi:hypothetical protein